MYTPSLAELGEVHLGRKKVQPLRLEVREFYEEAEELLAVSGDTLRCAAA